MASTRILVPVRGVTYQLSRLSIRQDALPRCCTKCLSTPFARSITTSPSSPASITPIAASAAEYVPIKPLEEQTVLATIHQFPSLEPLRFETYPANHLYLPTRRDILHRAVIYEGDMTRLGTASTKSRHEVRGSARKIRPQKGSGRARLGDKKSPMLRGGGVAFGPRPRDFASDLPKKVYDLAWRTALSYRYRKGELIIVDNAMEIESPSTRLLNDIFKYHEKLRGRGRSLLVTLNERPLLEEALVDMDRGGQALTWKEVDVKDLLELSRIIIERDALHNIFLSHQEDLTHTSIEPWHQRLVKSSRPTDLENIIGWTEFRDLQLKEGKEQDAARPGLYESVALKRYEYVAALPETAYRTDLSISAYTLLAEARELQFERHTGMSFVTYAELIQDSNNFESVAEMFPRIQSLEYQRSIKINLADKSTRISGHDAEVTTLENEAGTLELTKLKIAHHAALLAAQVHEHYAEAHRMSSDQETADDQLGLASVERESLDILAMQILELKLQLATSRLQTLEAKRVGGKKLEEARSMVRRLEAEISKGQVQDEDVEGEKVVEDAVEAPVVEEVRRQGDKR